MRALKKIRGKNIFRVELGTFLRLAGWRENRGANFFSKGFSFKMITTEKTLSEKNELWKNCRKKFWSRKNRKKTFFLKISKAKVVACPGLSKTLKNTSNGSKLTKNAQFFVRGGIKLSNTVYKKVWGWSYPASCPPSRDFS